MHLRPFWLFTFILLTLVGCGGGGNSSGQAAQPQDTAPLPESLAAPAGVSAQTTVGKDETVTVSWHEVDGATDYVLYWATAAGVDKATATKVEAVISPYEVTGLPGGTICWFSVSAVNDAGESDLSAEVSAMPRQKALATNKLNDTGIDWFADGTQNNLTVEPAGYEGQDASYGRDAEVLAGTLHKIGGGIASFDFTKLGSDGTPLADQNVDYATTPWECVRDNVTGLVWEVKTDDGGLRDKDNSFTWYNTDAASNGGSVGTPNGGSCAGGIDCDTAAYGDAVNAASLCGSDDWRLPTVEELRSIVDYGVPAPGPTVDTSYFPNAHSHIFFWSTSPHAGDSSLAWFIGFYNGTSYVNHKSSSGNVLLVRGGQ